MNIKKAIITVLAIAAISGTSLGLTSDIDPNGLQKPSWSLFSDTAYMIRENTWNCNVIGWVNYGIRKNVQIGTNLPALLFQMPNIYGKFLVREESENAAQIAVSSSLYFPLSTDTPITLDTALHAAKTIESDDLILHAGLKLTANINDKSYTTNNPVNSPGVGANAGIILNASRNMRTYIDIYYNWIPIDRNFVLASGMEFYQGDNASLTAGFMLYNSTNANRRANVLPFVNYQWNF